LKKYHYAAICLVFALLGLVAGGVIGFIVGTSNLPPNAWAGDGFGVMLEATFDAFWGAVTGFGVGSICCLLWRFLVQRRTTALAAAEAVPEDGEVWPPAPKMQVSGAVNAPSRERPSDAE